MNSRYRRYLVRQQAVWSAVLAALSTAAFAWSAAETMATSGEDGFYVAALISSCTAWLLTVAFAVAVAVDTARYALAEARQSRVPLARRGRRPIRAATDVPDPFGLYEAQFLAEARAVAEAAA